jgi:hypothetical protein
MNLENVVLFMSLTPLIILPKGPSSVLAASEKFSLQSLSTESVCQEVSRQGYED